MAVKGISVVIPPNVKTLAYKATAKCNVIMKSCSSGVRVGDATITPTYGFKMASQEPYCFNMEKNDELYVINDITCGIYLFITTPI